MVIKFVARANMHHLGQFLAGKRADAPQEALQILDIVLRELSTKRYNFLAVFMILLKSVKLNEQCLKSTSY